MKVAILAGGVGSRLVEETARRPKPMVEIGGRPILWHIMMHYSFHGFREFVIALGYRGEVIRRYMAGPRIEADAAGGWEVDLVDTGQETMTGGRIKRLAGHLGDGTFMLTWGDGVSTVDLGALLAFHRRHGRLATVTAVRPPPRFGRLDLDGETVRAFEEKPAGGEGWINGAFFVLEPGVLDYIEGDATQFEQAPLESLARDGQLMAYRHEGFWQCMDTVHDRMRLERLWQGGAAPWRVWA